MPPQSETVRVEESPPARSIPPIIPAHEHPVDGTIVPPIATSERESAPPLPTGVITPEPVPEAPKPQPIPMMRLIMPIVMVIAALSMVGLMFMMGGQLNPMTLVFPLMMPEKTPTKFVAHIFDIWGWCGRSHARMRGSNERISYIITRILKSLVRA